MFVTSFVAGQWFQKYTFRAFEKANMICLPSHMEERMTRDGALDILLKYRKRPNTLFQNMFFFLTPYVVGEEFIFRFLLPHVLSGVQLPLLSTILNSAMFSAMHEGAPEELTFIRWNTLFLGLSTSFVYMKFGWICAVAFHLGFNIHAMTASFQKAFQILKKQLKSETYITRVCKNQMLLPFQPNFHPKDILKINNHYVFYSNFRKRNNQPMVLRMNT